MSEPARARPLTFVVTGASTGIGRAVAEELTGRGHTVWATVRSTADRDAVAVALGPTGQVLRVDITDDEAVRAAGERIAAAGPVHGLVNNAGAAISGPLEYLPLDAFRRQLAVNLTGQLAVTQAVLPALRAARDRHERARIVTIGSIGGRIAGPMLGPYHASKFGLVGLTDTLRAELRPAGIEVILIEPGAVATPIWDRGIRAADLLTAELPAEAAARYRRQIESVRTAADRSARRGLDPRRAARPIVAALLDERTPPRRLVGVDARIAGLIARLPFRLRYRLTAAR